MPLAPTVFSHSCSKRRAMIPCRPFLYSSLFSFPFF
jgi:hypothetical protein